jgi:hexosaminidase
VRTVFLFLIVCATFASSSASDATQLNLMPMPSTSQMKAGQLAVDASFSVGISGYSDARLQRALDRFLGNLRRQTGMPPQALKVVEATHATLVIRCEHGSKDVQELGEDESYSLEVAPTGAKLDAATPLGVMHGLETFLQLVQTTPDGFAVPAVSIQDGPRFPWRGLMIDVGRHFIPLDVLKRNLDGMAAVKLNVFHWHLSDDQGFRIESKTFPKLHEMGSDGLYYTQDEARDLVAYARERGIRVVAEFDIPGHTVAWFPGYPELASGPGPYQIERKWGIFDPAMDPTQEHTYKFLDSLIGEMTKLFPDQFFHIGGDEVNGKQWDANPGIQAFMRAHGLRNNKDIQGYFNQRVQKMVSKHGKTMVGWDEIMRSDLPKDVVVQAWREESSVEDEVKQGFRGIRSEGYYLDLNWPASRHYAVDPMSGAAANMTPEQKQRVLGGEACMWSEYVSPENIDSRIWPRTAAIAERLWSPQEVTDVNSMYQRLERTSIWLDSFGLTHNSSYEPMLRRIAGSNDITALRTLIDIVEPVKDYDREELATTPATSLTPLNRVIDAARPESATARHFAGLVDELVAGQADPGIKQEIRMWLVRWRDNQTNLQSLEAQSFLANEVTPLSHDLSAVAAVGLQALDYIDHGERAPETWATPQLALLTEAQKPKAQLLLLVVSSIEKLVHEARRCPKCPSDVK